MLWDFVLNLRVSALFSWFSQHQVCLCPGQPSNDDALEVQSDCWNPGIFYVGTTTLLQPIQACFRHPELVNLPQDDPK